MFVCQYIYRPPTAFDLYEDCLKQCIFYGSQVLAENNRIGLINWFIEKGFSSYLMKRPEVTQTAYSRGQKTPGIPTSGEVVRDSLVSGIELYIIEAVGYNEDTNFGGKLYFNELAQDWLTFDINDWQKFDATVAAGLALLATKKHIKMRPPVPVDFRLVRTFKVKTRNR